MWWRSLMNCNPMLCISVCPKVEKSRKSRKERSQIPPAGGLSIRIFLGELCELYVRFLKTLRA